MQAIATGVASLQIKLGLEPAFRGAASPRVWQICEGSALHQGRRSATYTSMSCKMVPYAPLRLRAAVLLRRHGAHPGVSSMARLMSCSAGSSGDHAPQCSHARSTPTTKQPMCWDSRIVPCYT